MGNAFLVAESPKCKGVGVLPVILVGLLPVILGRRLIQYTSLEGGCDLWDPCNFQNHGAGQIVATSRDLGPPKGSFLEGKSSKISRKSSLVKYYNLARIGL